MRAQLISWPRACFYSSKLIYRIFYKFLGSIPYFSLFFFIFSFFFHFLLFLFFFFCFLFFFSYPSFSSLPCFLRTALATSPSAMLSHRTLPPRPTPSSPIAPLQPSSPGVHSLANPCLASSCWELAANCGWLCPCWPLHQASTKLHQPLLTSYFALACYLSSPRCYRCFQPPLVAHDRLFPA